MTKTATTPKLKPLVIHSRFNLPPKIKATFLDKNGDAQHSKTKQEFKEEADVNNIVKKHGRLAIQQAAATAIKNYGDFTEINEYQVSLDLINTSRSDFAKLPSDIRRKFGNNPGEFLEFATNPDNAEKLYDMGLAKRPIIETKEKPIDVNIITPEKTEETPK